MADTSHDDILRSSILDRANCETDDVSLDDTMNDSEEDVYEDVVSEQFGLRQLSDGTHTPAMTVSQQPATTTSDTAVIIRHRSKDNDRSGNTVSTAIIIDDEDEDTNDKDSAAVHWFFAPRSKLRCAFGEANVASSSHNEKAVDGSASAASTETLRRSQRTRRPATCTASPAKLPDACEDTDAVAQYEELPNYMKYSFFCQPTRVRWLLGNALVRAVSEVPIIRKADRLRLLESTDVIQHADSTSTDAETNSNNDDTVDDDDPALVRYRAEQAAAERERKSKFDAEHLDFDMSFLDSDSDLDTETGGASDNDGDSDMDPYESIRSLIHTQVTESRYSHYYDQANKAKFSLQNFDRFAMMELAFPLSELFDERKFLAGLARVAAVLETHYVPYSVKDSLLTAVVTPVDASLTKVVAIHRAWLQIIDAQPWFGNVCDQDTDILAHSLTFLTTSGTVREPVYCKYLTLIDMLLLIVPRGMIDSKLSDKLSSAVKASIPTIRGRAVSVAVGEQHYQYFATIRLSVLDQLDRLCDVFEPLKWLIIE